MKPSDEAKIGMAGIQSRQRIDFDKMRPPLPVAAHIDPAAIPAEMKDVLSGEKARTYGVVPLSRGNNVVTVAISDPMNYDTLDSLRYLLKCNVDAVVARRQEIAAALDKRGR